MSCAQNQVCFFYSGDKENVQCWGSSRTGLRTTELEHPLFHPNNLTFHNKNLVKNKQYMINMQID